MFLLVNHRLLTDWLSGLFVTLFLCQSKSELIKTHKVVKIVG